MSKPVLHGVAGTRRRHRSCAEGRHAPGEARSRDDAGFLRTRCRLCGAELVQIFPRSWIVSGMLG